MTTPFKCAVNPILAKNEVSFVDLVVGKEYLLEYNVYHINKIIKIKGVFMHQECLIEPHIVTYFQTNEWIYPEMYHEAHTRYYIPITDVLCKLSLERQAFAQSINKLSMDRKGIKGWRRCSNKNSLGYELVKIYYATHDKII
jgi:hypothetical protein